jgi:hypothetical protein
MASANTTPKPKKPAAKKIGKKSDGVPAKIEKTKFQSFTMEHITRAQIKNADYNPRSLSPEARALLKKKMGTTGLVQPIVWNKRTGNIVGGHQRVRVLDDLESGEGYSMDVAVVDVDSKTEKELNVFLNNPEAQGDWDMDKLKDLFNSEGFDVEEAGYSLADVYRFFGDVSANVDEDKLAELSDKLASERQKYVEYFNDSSAIKNSPNFYFLAIFKDAADMDDFLDELGLPRDSYQSGKQLLDRIRAKIKGEDVTV